MYHPDDFVVDRYCKKCDKYYRGTVCHNGHNSQTGEAMEKPTKEIKVEGI